MNKIFTVTEAEQLIPELEKIVESLMINKKSAMEIGDDLTRLQEHIKQSASSPEKAAVNLLNKQTELEFMIRVINEGLDAIESLGAEPKDLDLGLVDFPAVIEGEPALLCWKFGEKSIRYYHGHSEGFAGRKPLVQEQELKGN
jgi:hypothetical protein